MGDEGYELRGSRLYVGWVHKNAECLMCNDVQGYLDGTGHRILKFRRSCAVKWEGRQFELTAIDLSMAALPIKARVCLPVPAS
jgi:hypothetical protein